MLLNIKASEISSNGKSNLPDKRAALKERWINALYLELKSKPRNKLDVFDRLEIRYENHKNRLIEVSWFLELHQT